MPLSVENDEGQDLRSSVEAAFEAATTEKPLETPPAQTTTEVVPKDETKPVEAVPEDPPKETAEAAPPVETPAVNVPGEEPPKAWKSGIRDKHWTSLPSEVKQEVLRREREVAKVFGESSQVRQFASQFAEAIRPYEARIRSNNMQPIQAVERLLQADHLLSSAPPVQRAQYMARLIREYGVDIKELDSALAGEQPADPVSSKVEALLQQRLAPLNQFLAYQQRQQQQAEQERAQQAATEIEAMANDTVKYPYFEQVREQMAELVDFYAANNKYMPLDQIYSRAVALDPQLGPQAIANQAKNAQLSTAQAQHQQAQRAQAASLSVSGTRGIIPTPANANASLRDSVEAAWAAHQGR